jgi:hypothetical protein
MELDNDIFWPTALPKTADCFNVRHKLDIAAVAVHPVLHRSSDEYAPFVSISTVKRAAEAKVKNFLRSDFSTDGPTITIDCVNPDFSPLDKSRVYTVDFSENSGTLRFDNRNNLERWVWDLIAYQVVASVRGLIVHANSMKNIPQIWLTWSSVGFIDPKMEDPNLALLKGVGNFFDTIDSDSVHEDEVLGWIKHISSTKITRI